MRLWVHAEVGSPPVGVVEGLPQWGGREVRCRRCRGPFCVLDAAGLLEIRRYVGMQEVWRRRGVRQRPPPPPPSRTKWTRLVHPSVLIGHVSSRQASAEESLATIDGNGLQALTSSAGYVTRPACALVPRTPTASGSACAARWKDTEKLRPAHAACHGQRRTGTPPPQGDSAQPAQRASPGPASALTGHRRRRMRQERRAAGRRPPTRRPRGGTARP